MAKLTLKANLALRLCLITLAIVCWSMSTAHDGAKEAAPIILNFVGYCLILFPTSMNKVKWRKKVDAPKPEEWLAYLAGFLFFVVFVSLSLSVPTEHRPEFFSPFRLGLIWLLFATIDVRHYLIAAKRQKAHAEVEPAEPEVNLSTVSS